MCVLVCVMVLFVCSVCFGGFEVVCLFVLSNFQFLKILIYFFSLCFFFFLSQERDGAVFKSIGVCVCVYWGGD